MSSFLSILLSLVKVGAALAVLGTLFVVGGYLGVQWALSAEEFDVPDVKGMELDAARRELSARGLIVEVDPVQLTDQEVPEGRVLIQNPLAGTAIKRQRRILLTLSKGQPPRQLPLMVGGTLQHAQISLQQKDVEVQYVARVHSDTYAKDQVIGQQPNTTGLPEGEAVDVRLLVSLGPSPKRYLMPDLAYRSAVDLQRGLESLGFQVRVRDHGAVVRGLSPDTIIRHTPSPGFPIAAGEAVVLYVNR